MIGYHWPQVDMTVVGFTLHKVMVQENPQGRKEKEKYAQ